MAHSRAGWWAGILPQNERQKPHHPQLQDLTPRPVISQFAAWITKQVVGWPTSSESFVRESRRSTRVRLKVVIEAQGISDPLSCEGETITVNLHGALLLTAVALRVGTRITIRVLLTDKHATADVVWIDPEHPRLCGIALVKPQNIWGVSLPPPDWHEDDLG